jgi:hypothetical protein
MNCEIHMGFFMCGLLSQKDVWVYGRKGSFITTGEERY